MGCSNGMLIPPYVGTVSIPRVSLPTRARGHFVNDIYRKDLRDT